MAMSDADLLALVAKLKAENDALERSATDTNTHTPSVRGCVVLTPSEAAYHLARAKAKRFTGPTCTPQSVQVVRALSAGVKEAPMSEWRATQLGLALAAQANRESLDRGEGPLSPFRREEIVAKEVERLAGVKPAKAKPAPEMGPHRCQRQQDLEAQIEALQAILASRR
jgi:hypothetical protein